MKETTVGRRQSTRNVTHSRVNEDVGHVDTNDGVADPGLCSGLGLRLYDDVLCLRTKILHIDFSHHIDIPACIYAV